eukprot:1146135-Pelagomonas_calceolata.AAC.8
MRKWVWSPCTGPHEERITQKPIATGPNVMRKYARLFCETSPQTRVPLGPTSLLYSEVSIEDVHHFIEQDSNQMYYFLSEVMDIFCVAGRGQQAEQSNHLTEGQDPM